MYVSYLRRIDIKWEIYFQCKQLYIHSTIFNATYTIFPSRNDLMCPKEIVNFREVNVCTCVGECVRTRRIKIFV